MKHKIMLKIKHFSRSMYVIQAYCIPNLKNIIGEIYCYPNSQGFVLTPYLTLI